MSSSLEVPIRHSGAASSTLYSSNSMAEAAFARENLDMDLDLGQEPDYDRLLESGLSSPGLQLNILLILNLALTSNSAIEGCQSDNTRFYSRHQ